MASLGFFEDISVMKRLLSDLPKSWEGKSAVLELKAANYNWKQMEWWAFYFEHLCFQRLQGSFQVPGDRSVSTTFDLKRSFNWDLKCKAIKSDDHRTILNDCSAMEWSVSTYGEHGAVVALCDVEYNDENRAFQTWHSELKGGKSKYEDKRLLRTTVSRYRKTRADLTELLFLRFDEANLGALGRWQQGQNSNTKPRPRKFMLDLEQIAPFLIDRLEF